MWSIKGYIINLTRIGHCAFGIIAECDVCVWYNFNQNRNSLKEWKLDCHMHEKTKTPFVDRLHRNDITIERAKNPLLLKFGSIDMLGQ